MAQADVIAHRKARVNLQTDDFTLFGLEQRFEQDRAVIDTRWKELQRLAHPDRFAAQGPSAQRMAMQWSVRINEAYRRLKDPLLRAAYLCELRGASIEAESNTAMPTSFLFEQMAWREALDEARDVAAVEALFSTLGAKRQEVLDKLLHSLDRDSNPDAAAQQVRALMFIERFAHDVEARMDQLGQ